jgi:hypothetical protein
MSKLSERSLQAISAYISNLSGDDRVRHALSYSLGRVFANMERRGENWRDSIDMAGEDHIVDWLTSAVINNEHWLSNVDAHGRPKKLLKFSTVADITGEADRAMIAFARNNRTIKPVDGDEALVTQLADGFHIVRLMTPRALDAESGLMQHCIGQGAYDRKVASEHYHFYSLRDPWGKPHATLEVDLRRLVLIQCQGKQNTAPVERYLELLVGFLTARGIVFGQVHPHHPFVFDEAGNRHPVCDLPDGFTVRSDLCVCPQSLAGNKKASLPRRLTVHGDFAAKGVTLARLPAQLKAVFKIRLDECVIEQPGGYMAAASFRASKITAPNGICARLLMRGGIAAAGVREAKVFPEVRHAEQVWIANSDFEDLRNVRPKKLLTIKGCGPMRLADDLEVGSLLITDTAITSLPESMRVKETLQLTNTRVVSLPRSIDLDDTLSLMGSPITELPENIRVGKSTVLSGTGIKALPRGCSFQGGINLSNSSVEDIEALADTVVDGVLNIENSKVSRLPDGLRVEGQLRARGSALSSVGQGVSIGGYADITGTPLAAIGPMMTVEGLTVGATMEATVQDRRMRP